MSAGPGLDGVCRWRSPSSWRRARGRSRPRRSQTSPDLARGLIEDSDRRLARVHVETDQRIPSGIGAPLVELWAPRRGRNPQREHLPHSLRGECRTLRHTKDRSSVVSEAVVSAELSERVDPLGASARFGLTDHQRSRPVPSRSGFCCSRHCTSLVISRPECWSSSDAGASSGSADLLRFRRQLNASGEGGVLVPRRGRRIARGGSLRADPSRQIGDEPQRKPAKDLGTHPLGELPDACNAH
jgi:hypothetical protein